MFETQDSDFPATSPRKVVLICHAEDRLNREGTARWLASFCQLVGIIELHEPPQRFWQRVRREIRRVGLWRLLDVLAFRVFYRLRLSRTDAAWEAQRLGELTRQYRPLPPGLPVLRTSSPNAGEVVAFLQTHAPDFVIARCKTLLKPRIFTIPPQGVFVLHPGICPQYRNAHGCFWALAQGDSANVGLTLLKIDRGVDTGPVYGYFRCKFDPLRESHHVIQQRVCFDNLPAIQAKLDEILNGVAVPINTQGQPSGEWGQPWLTAYLRYRRAAQRNEHAHRLAVS